MILPYKDPEKAKANKREYNKTHAKQINKQKNKKHRELKYEVMKEFSKRQSNSNVPCCACCGEYIVEFLSIDHVDGRKVLEHGTSMMGTRLYYWARRNDYPPTLQVLCFNCNCAKGSYGICPHKEN